MASSGHQHSADEQTVEMEPMSSSYRGEKDNTELRRLLHTYDQKLTEKGIAAFKLAEKRARLQSVVLLLRRHNSNGRLCCDNNENDLEVADIDSNGFVTHVKCTNCQQTTKASCNDAKWTYERIYNEEQLKPGDHICWHRFYTIWHHAIVKTMGPEKTVIHYSDFEVKTEPLSKVRGSCSNCCNALHRINYEDCYDVGYSLLRAEKLLGESRYDLLERNCEHFSRWCKTGSTSSSQVGIMWASFGKVVATIVLRAFALILLGLLQYSHESQEDQVKDRQQFEGLEKELIVFYMVLITAAFIIYLLFTSGSRLYADPCKDIKHQRCSSCSCSCSKLYAACTENRCIRMRCFLCFVFGILNLCCRAIDNLLFCRHIRCSPCTCCGRPCNLACGLFWRIFLRETLAGAGTLIVLLHEEVITEWGYIAKMSAGCRTAVLILISAGAQVLGYIAGVILGRLAEACCDCGGDKKHSVRIHSRTGYETIQEA